MSDEKKEPEGINWVNDEVKMLERLGLNYETHGVDPENVAPFAKIMRVIGLSIIVIFILWGLTYDWTSSRGPFEQIFYKMFGWRSPNELIAVGFSCIIATIGWRYRFIIGATSCTLFLLAWDRIKKLYQSI